MEKKIKRNFAEIAAVWFGVFILALLAYWPALHEPLFFIDDPLYLSSVPKGGLTLKNLLYVLTPVTKPVYLPLVDLSYLIDFAIADFFSVDPNVVMRLVNFAWLAGCAVWVLKLTQLLFAGQEKSRIHPSFLFLPALLFSMHPLHAIPAVWIAARKDALICFMGLGLVHAIFRRRHARALFFYILAFASKQSAYGLFLWVMAIELFFVLSQGLPQWQATFRLYVKRVWPFLLVFLLIFPLSFSLSSAHPRVNAYVFPQTFLTYLFYLQKVFFPYPITQYYPRPPSLNTIGTLLSFVVIAAGFFAVCWLGMRKRINAMLAGLLFLTFLGMLPYFSVFPSMLLITNGYAYTLVAPCVLLFSWWMVHRINRKPLMTTLFVLLILGGFSYSRILAKEFCDPVAAFERNARLYPHELFLKVRWAHAANAEGRSSEAAKIYDDILINYLKDFRLIHPPAFEGLLSICIKENNVACLTHLGSLASRNSNNTFCKMLSEYAHMNSPILNACKEKFPL